MNGNCDYYIRADSIFTETGFLSSRVLHLSDGIIRGFYDELPPHREKNVLDYSGYRLTSLLCDYHLHFRGSTPEDFQKSADTLISAGINSVIEGGDENKSGLRARSVVRDQLRIQAAGLAIYKKGTYGRLIGRGVSDVREARELIKVLKSDGVDYIKVIHSGIFDPDKGIITPGGFERGELREIVHIASEAGLHTACHANGQQQVREAVDAGAKWIIHGLETSKDTLAIMADKGISFVPTINAFACLESRATDDTSKENVQRVVHNHMETVWNAYDSGVSLLPGSDAGPSFIPYGSSYYDELVSLSKAGLPVEYIIASAATPLRKGQRPDFILLKGLEVQAVFLDGKCRGGQGSGL